VLKETTIKALLVIVAVLFCVNIISSCSRDGAKTQSESKIQFNSEAQSNSNIQNSSEKQLPPSEVVTASYMAANGEKYAEAEKYLSSDAKKAIQEAKELAAGIKDVWDIKTRNRTIETVEIIRGDVQNDTATIAIRIHFKDGSIFDASEQLIKEGGQWKMTL
jgi:hypothetical protein